jgi:hypothetical protein
MYDPITTQLDTYATLNGRRIAELRQEQRHLVFESLQLHREKVFSGSNGFSALTQCFCRGEIEFQRIIPKLPKDAWLAYIRRLPIRDPALVALITLALCKHSKVDSEIPLKTMEEVLNSGDSEAAIIADEIWEQVLILWFTGDAMLQAAKLRRTVGKGARLVVNNGAIRLEAADQLSEAINQYEGRRPKDTLFGDHGFLLKLKLPDLKLGFLTLVAFDQPKYFYVPNRDIRLLFKYYIRPYDAFGLETFLRPYEEALNEDLKISVDAIMHCLVALGTLTVGSMLVPDQQADDGIESFDQDDGSATYDAKLSFTYDIGHKGYLRFSKEMLLNRLSTVSTPWSRTKPPRALVEEFLSALTLTHDKARKIDLSSPNVIPLLHESFDNSVYIDFLMARDFIGSLIEEGKKFYRSFHGERFPLALKRFIQMRYPMAFLEIGRKVKLPGKSSPTDIDLLVQRGTTLFSIECKAYSKSLAYRRGEPKAVKLRRDDIREAVRQAKRAAGAFAIEVNGGTTEFPENFTVEWLVCTPTQEFLYPLSEHGLFENVPRVLTPEELLSILGDQSMAPTMRHP